MLSSRSVRDNGPKLCSVLAITRGNLRGKTRGALGGGGGITVAHRDVEHG
jgi:hypothetical protein